MKKLASLLLVFVSVLLSAEAAKAAAPVTINDCDTAEGWFSNGAESDGKNLTVDTADKKQGAGCLQFTQPVTTKVMGMEYRSGGTVDISGAQSIELDMYLSDASLVTSSTDAQIEISSSQVNDDAELNWNFSYIKTLGLTNGWNHLVLPLSSTQESMAAGNKVDLTKICYFRIYFVHSMSGTKVITKLDNIRATLTKKADPPARAKGVLHACDSLAGWNSTSTGRLALDTRDKKEGAGSIKFSFNAGDPSILAELRTDSTDFSAFTTLEFSLYLSDAKVITNSKDMQIEISSNEVLDDAELNWIIEDIQALGLKAGWNNVALPLARGHYSLSSGHKVDLKKICYFRFYSICEPTSTREVVIKVDNVRATNAAPATTTAANTAGSTSGVVATTADATAKATETTDETRTSAGDTFASTDATDPGVSSAASSSFNLWFVIVPVIVLACGGVAVFIILRKRKSSN